MTAARKIDTKAIDLLAWQIRAAKLPVPEREWRFARALCGGDGPGVRLRLLRAGLQDWRMDFAWPAQLVALEMDGGLYTGGRHVQGSGAEEDARKLSTAVAAGWRVLRASPRHVKQGQAVLWIAAVLAIVDADKQRERRA